MATACIGTPFKDSLTSEQMAIKKEAADQRRRIFLTGLAAGGIVIIFEFQGTGSLSCLASKYDSTSHPIFGKPVYEMVSISTLNRIIPSIELLSPIGTIPLVGGT